VTTPKTIVRVFCILMSQTWTVFAGDLLPEGYEITNDGLQITKSFDRTLEVGDVITHAEGEKLKPRLAQGIIRRLAKKKDTLQLTINRGEQTLQHNVTLVSQDELNALREKQELADKENNKKEELKRWFATNKPKDSHGKTWSQDEIEAHNDPIWDDILRIIRKHKDARLDANGSKSLGTQLGDGFYVIKRIEEVAQATKDEPVELPRTRRDPIQGAIRELARCPTLDDMPGFLGDLDFKYVERLFEFTDAENYLIWCRNGEVMSAEQLWLKLTAMTINANRAANADEKKEKELGQWFAKNKLTDSRGRIWSIDEIRAHNLPIEVGYMRIARKTRDAAIDEEHNRSAAVGVYGKPESLGQMIDRGFSAIENLASIVQAPKEYPHKVESRVWDEQKGWYQKVTELRTLGDAAKLANDNTFKFVEELFDQTDMENYLIWCRNGEVISAEQLWLKFIACFEGKHTSE